MGDISKWITSHNVESAQAFDEAATAAAARQRQEEIDWAEAQRGYKNSHAPVQTHCVVCGRQLEPGNPSRRRQEFVGPRTESTKDSTGKTWDYADPIQDGVECSDCEAFHALRNGTAYWTEQDWQNEQDATYIEWEPRS